MSAKGRKGWKEEAGSGASPPASGTDVLIALIVGHLTPSALSI